MYVLRIEHSTSNFEEWKRLFDSDPIGRQRSGVVNYRVMQPVDDDHYVMVDMEFNSAQQAEALLAALQQLWDRLEGDVIMAPAAMVVEIVESREL